MRCIQTFSVLMAMLSGIGAASAAEQIIPGPNYDVVAQVLLAEDYSTPQMRTLLVDVLSKADVERVATRVKQAYFESLQQETSIAEDISWNLGIEDSPLELAAVMNDQISMIQYALREFCYPEFFGADCVPELIGSVQAGPDTIHAVYELTNQTEDIARSYCFSFVREDDAWKLMLPNAIAEYLIWTIIPYEDEDFADDQFEMEPEQAVLPDF